MRSIYPVARLVGKDNFKELKWVMTGNLGPRRALQCALAAIGQSPFPLSPFSNLATVYTR
jgi:hypothetical protein